RGMPGRPRSPPGRPPAGPGDLRARSQAYEARPAQRDENGPVPRPGRRAPRPSGGRAAHRRVADLHGTRARDRAAPRRGPDRTAPGRARGTEREQVMKIVIILAVVLLLATALKWVFWPGRGLPRNRVRFMRMRLHLRLHPGRGFATTWELWLRWGRLASLRRSGRIRRSLSFIERAGWPRLHSIWLGRAQYRHRLRLPLEEQLLVMGPPR